MEKIVDFLYDKHAKTGEDYPREYRSIVKIRKRLNRTLDKRGQRLLWRAIDDGDIIATRMSRDCFHAGMGAGVRLMMELFYKDYMEGRL